MTELNRDTNILIVGLGLIGGSYAKALTKKGYKINAISKEQSDIDFAISEGFIADGTTDKLEEFIKAADLIILALYPHTLIKWVEENRNFFKSGTIITDVTGVKEFIINKVQALMPENVEFIAAHPMAGREKSGVRYSDDSVFKNANYIIVPSEKNSEHAKEICKKLGFELGFHNISILNAKEHDEMIAFLSQLTHCIAVSLMCTGETDGFEAYTGDSFRDLTRIAKINDEMWSELFLCNKEALLRKMNEFSKQFEIFKKALESNDRETMRKMMKKSTLRREKFDKTQK